VPRESFDAPEHLPKEAPRQVPFGQLEDEADPREQLAGVMLDLGDHPPGATPGGGLVLEES
jgi:hypothetical protein